MFRKEFIKKHLIEYMTFDIGLLIYIFQFYFYVYLYGHPFHTFFSVFFPVYFVVTSIILLRLKLYRKKDPYTRLYGDFYLVFSLSMLLISRVVYSTISNISWPALIIPIMLVLLVLYRVLLNKTYFTKRIYHSLFLIFTILLNVISLIGLFVHMMFFQG